ncbi:MAG: hypothetical protein FWE15_31550, partial [Actinomycetia bacterium]|nr:hypothetical protein [Actinomycetes bacterium]
MRRTTTTFTTAVLTAAVAVALGGCSSSDKSSSDAKATTTPPATPSAAPTTTAPAVHVDGHLDYTGASTGSADFTGGVRCEVVGGRFMGITAPDLAPPAMKKAAPSFIAAPAPYKLASLVTADRKSYSVNGNVQGLDAHRSGGTWIVTVQNLKIGTLSGDPGVTVNGSLTCTKVTTK